MPPIDINSDATLTGAANNGHGNGGHGNGTLVPLGNRFEVAPAIPWQMGPPARPEILTAKANPMELLHALRRRWWLATGLGILVAAVLVGLVYLLVPVRYEAAALLRVLQKTPTIIGSTAGAQDDFITYKRNQQQLVKSRLVLTAVLRNRAIANLSLIRAQDDPITWLEGQLMVDFPGDAELLRVAMKGEDPKQLTLIVNAVKDSYLKEIVNVEKDARLEIKARLEAMHAQKKEEIRKKQEALHTTITKRNGNSDTQRVLQQVNHRRLETLIADADKVQDQIRALDMKILLIKAKTEQLKGFKIPDYFIDEEINKDPQIQVTIQAISKLRTELTGLEASLGKNSRNPRVQSMRSTLQQMEEDIDERRAELRPVLIERFINASADGSGAFSLPLMETEKEALNSGLEEANRAIQQQLEEVKKFDNYSVDIEAKQAELNELMAITQKMGSEVKLWEVEALAKDRIMEVEPASEPKSNDAIRKYVGVAFVGVLGFGLVLFGVAYVEFQSRRLNSVRQVHEGLGLQVMGELPPLSKRAFRKLGSGKRGSLLRAQLNESIDSIRTALLYSTSIDSPRVVMVTSADPQEGKTTVASQLAASLARSGRRTVLIDLDLRNPSLHRVFDIPQEPGLCELLRGQAERDAVIQPAQQPNLWLMPAGRCDMDSVQALSSDALGTVIEALKSQYGFVVIDAGPVLKVADPMLVGQHADAAILSVQRDISKVPSIYEASERLRSVGVTVLGAVVNGVQTRAGRHGIDLQSVSAAS